MRKSIGLLIVVGGLLAGWLWAGAPAQAERLRAITETPTPTATTPAGSTATPLPSLTPPAAPVVVDPLITKRVNLDRAVVGDLAEYTLLVSNPNEAALLNVTVTDPLPTQVTFISGNTTAGALTFEAAARTVTVVIGQLDAHQVVTVTIQTRVNATGQAPDLVINTAQVAFSNLVGQGFLVASNPAALQMVPGQLPATGYGPGPREWATLWIAVGLLLAGLGRLAVWAWARRR